MYEENPRLYVPCTCGEEVLAIEKEAEDSTWCVSIYSQWETISLWEKLKYIWRILRHGRPYGDQVVLDTSGVDRVSSFIAAHRKEAEAAVTSKVTLEFTLPEDAPLHLFAIHGCELYTALHNVQNMLRRYNKYEELDGLDPHNLVETIYQEFFDETESVRWLFEN